MTTTIYPANPGAYNSALRKGKPMRVLQKALTFDDVLLVPAHSAILPRDVQLGTRLTRSISLNLPILSAAMDTVTEARLAIAMPRRRTRHYSQKHDH